ncbi:MAG: phosphatidylcholine/phosphatidylserine synthase [Phycisphaerae bacterium]
MRELQYLRNMNEPTEKSERQKRSLLRSVRKQRLRYITVLPSLITLINGVCGFASIVFAAKAGQVDNSGLNVYPSQFPFLSMAGYMIFWAMIADMLDGHVARISHSTSSFGGQLDSLCDVISFGVAPAFLMLRVVEGRVSFHPTFDVFVYRFLWLSAAIYISCAAIRLARFNVENEEDESNHSSFSGLPSPAAAGVVASLVVLNHYILTELSLSHTTLSNICHNIIIGVLPFAALAAAILMVTRVTYPHFVNAFLRGKKPFAYLFWTMAVLVIIVSSLEVALALVFCGFAVSGVARWLYMRFVMHKTAADDAEEPPVITISH